MTERSPIPVHIITGPLGVGKTTAIARLLADKPQVQRWLVVLNEFTDTGIDAITLAAAARGAYDLRMIPGGCLCCTGEADFRQQLSAVLANDPEYWPERILVEPSGIGHPGTIVEELRLFERGGALSLRSTVVLLDIQRMQAIITGHDSVTEAQVAAADVVVLAKADLVSAAQRRQFVHWASSLFPPKRFVGLSEHGALPTEALSPPPASFAFTMPSRPESHQQAHEHAPHLVHRQLEWAGLSVNVAEYRLLARSACGWVAPSGLLFDGAQLQSLLAATAQWEQVERFKAVLRTDVDQWQLLQRWDGQFAMTSCPWQQDSRIEVQLYPDVTPDWPSWDGCWQALAARSPVA